MARICRWCGLIAVALVMVMACNKEKTSNKREHNAANIGDHKDDHQADIPFKENNAIDIPINTVVIADNEAIPPLPPAPIPIGDGYGGGSQGALQPFNYSNDDDDQETPHGICGNGSQEVLANNNGCPFLLYGVANDDDDGVGTLLAFDVEDRGFASPIGVIDPNIIKNITGIDFSPQGVLYAVGQNNNNEYILATIDCRNASPTFINNLDLGGLGLQQLIPYNTTDISFDSFGILYAYIRNGIQQDRLGYVSTITGLISSYIDIGDNNLVSSANFGLGNKPFPFDTLYHAGTSLYNLNKNNGLSSLINALSFVDPANNNPFINGLDADYFTQIMYASIENGGSHYLGILDTFSGEVSFLSEPPLEITYDLKAIAVNRQYEPCDPLAIEPVLPSGSTCTEDCHLIESNCADGLDNDGNGLIDCADEACRNKTCNDNDVCTYNDTCINLCANEELPCLIASPWQCVGTIEPCYDGNECTLDICVPNNNNTFDCVHNDIDTTNYGSCTPDDSCSARNPDGSCPSDNITNFCLLGTCVEGSCEEEDKSIASVNIGGCNTSSADCVVNVCVPETGECLYGILENCSLNTDTPPL